MHERDALGTQTAGRTLDLPGYLIHRLDLIVLDVDTPIPSLSCGLTSEHLQLGRGPAGHFQHQVVRLQRVEERHQLGVGPTLDRLAAVVPETEGNRPLTAGDPSRTRLIPVAAMEPSAGAGSNRASWFRLGRRPYWTSRR
jgi:hypothetical protein